VDRAFTLAGAAVLVPLMFTARKIDRGEGIMRLSILIVKVVM